MRACDEDVAQVADGVALDIVHVAEAPEGLGVEGLAPEGVEVDVLDLQACREPLVGGGVESHTKCSVLAPNGDELRPKNGASAQDRYETCVTPGASTTSTRR